MVICQQESNTASLSTFLVPCILVGKYPSVNKMSSCPAGITTWSMKQTFNNVGFGVWFGFWGVFLFCFVFSFLGPHPWLMEVPRLGVELELELPAYTKAMAKRDPSCIFDLHHNSQQCWILNPLSKARDRTHISMDPSWVR